MPYIKEGRRDFVKRMGGANVGDLTYILYKTCLDYLGTSPSFSDFAEVLGALEAYKLELYRRKIAPYEDKKIEENGDVT